MGNNECGFQCDDQDQPDWNLNLNVALETGGWLVSDEIKISIELDLAKQAEQAARETAAETTA